VITRHRTADRSIWLAALLASLTIVASVASTASEPQTPPSPGATVLATPLADLERAFRTPPDDARIMMRWWWFGPSVTKAGLEREMRLMKDAGIGGFEIQPVYPVALDDPAHTLVTLPFLSDAFIDHLRFTAVTARELGLRVDLTIGSGWPYGGPQIDITQAAGKLRIERVPVSAGSARVPVPDLRAARWRRRRSTRARCWMS